MLWWKYQQLRMGNRSSRLAVVQELAASDNDAAVGPLIFALKDRHPAVRCAAARGLFRYRDRTAVSPLIERLKDPAPEVRAAVAETLGHMGDPVAVNPMVALLMDPDLSVRGAASLALEKLGWHPGDDSLRVLQVLAMGRTDAAACLGPGAVGPLIDVLRAGEPNKQFEAVKALGQIDDPRVKPAMLEALTRDNPAIRISALGTLERIGDPLTLPAIEKFLTDCNASVRAAAVEAVRSCGRNNAVPALLRMVKDSSWEVRQAAAKGLGILADPVALDGLSALLADTDRDVQETAIAALGRIGNRRAVPQLALALVDKDSAVRSAAAAALGTVDPHWEKNPALRLILPKLKTALDHHEYWVRHSAVKLFARLKVDPATVNEIPETPAPSPVPTHPAFSVLADLMFDHDRDLRLAAVEAFGHLHDPNALPLVNAALHDADANVQRAARQAIADIR